MEVSGPSGILEESKRMVQRATPNFINVPQEDDNKIRDLSV
jgi:hypothetical protein